MNLDQLIEKVLTETAYRENPYFVNLKNGNFEKADFVETQIQFYYAVIFFSRPMAALAAKIPSPELRLEVLRNVWEEHGSGQLAHGHGRTFLEFLRRLDGITPEEVQLRALWPEIRIFNTALSGVSVLDDFLVGVAATGIIERMFSDISAWLGEAVISRGWLSKSELVHYRLHEQLDIKHSDDFFEILKKPYSRSELNRYHIEQGLRFGATLFNDLYLGLWRSRKHRWVLNTVMPPSRTADEIP